MDNLNLFAGRAAEATAHCLLHGAWQGALVGLVALAIVRLGRRWPAPVRYWLLVLALVKFATPPFVALPIGLFSLVAVDDQFEKTGGPGGGVSPAVLSDHPPAPRFSLDNSTSELPVASRSSDPQAGDDGAAQQTEVSLSTSLNSAPLTDSLRTTTTYPRGSTPAAAAVPLGWFARWVPPWLLLAAIVIYFGGVFILSTLFVTRAAHLHASRRGMALPNAALVESMAVIAWKLGLRRIPALLISQCDEVPFSVGVFRPAVVLPARLVRDLSADERHAVLCHELAHHRRGDLWLNLLQVAIGIVWWFHPVVWLLNRAIRAVREECCDDLLLARNFVTEEDYCTTLVRVAERHSHHRLAGVGVSMSEGPHPLAIRIRRIMDEGLGRTDRPGRLSILALGLTALVLLPGVRAVPTSAKGAAAGDWPVFRPNQNQLVFAEPRESSPSRTADQSPSTRSPPDAPATGSIFGRVTDADGGPISSAAVVLEATVSSQASTSRTDGEGRYRFDGRPIGPTIVTVLKPGLAPALRTVDVGSASAESALDFQLLPGRSIQVRVIDAEGNPVAGASVIPDTWREARTLSVSHSFGTTDADGRWSWDWAPADAIHYNIFKSGYMGIMASALAPRAEPYELKLLPELRVAGTVVDDATGKPVTAYRVIAAHVYSDGAKPLWTKGESTVTADDGRYAIALNQPFAAILLRIEAKGYLPRVSREIRSDEGDVALDFRLQSGILPWGIVVAPDGTPAHGVAINVGTPTSSVSLRDDKIEHRTLAARSEADGSFHLLVQNGDFTVVACSNAGIGFARRSDFENGDNEPARITLKPWARIKGILAASDGSPGIQTVRLQFPVPGGRPNELSPFVSTWYRTQTTEDGRFEFDRIPPEFAVQVIHTIPIPWNNYKADGMGAAAQLKLAPGQSQSITLGTTARALSGRVTPAEGGNEAIDWEAYFGELVRLKLPGNPIRKETAKVGESPAAATLSRAPGAAEEATTSDEPILVSPGHFLLRRDGSFRIEGVSPGKYMLRIMKFVTDRPAPGKLMVVPLATQEVNVPETEPDATAASDPIDLGTLKVAPVPAK